MIERIHSSYLERLDYGFRTLTKLSGSFWKERKSKPVSELTSYFHQSHLSTKVRPAIYGLINLLGQTDVWILWQQVQVNLIKLVFLAKRRSAIFIASKVSSCSCRLVRSQVSKEHLDSADSHVRPPCIQSLLSHQMTLSKFFFLVTLPVPSLNPRDYEALTSGLR